MTSFIGRTILVLEDDPDFKNIIELFFEDMGARVLACETVEEAKRIIASRDIHIILSDFHLKRSNAKSFLPEILAASSISPKVFVLSGDQALDESDMKRLGADGLFHKPIQLEVLAKFLVKIGQEQGLLKKIVGTDSFQQQGIRLEIKSGEKLIPCDFFEAETDGIFFLCSKALRVGERYCAGIKGPFEKDFESTGTVQIVECEPDEREDDEEESGQFLTYLKFDHSDLDNWREVLEGIQNHREQINDFLKKASGL